MKAIKAILLLIPFLIYNCSGEKNIETEKPNIKIKKTTTKQEKKPTQKGTFTYLNVDLNSKGSGPIQSLELKKRIDKKMVTEGKAVFNRLCAACHRIDKKFIGPEMNGLLDRRNPEWVMNTLLDPEGMIKNDSLTKLIYEEFNQVIMPNQNPTEDEARAMLEYFRTLK